MSKPKALVLTGYGINCEEETAFAFNLAGGVAEIVHINDLIDGKEKLKDFQILAFPGGFAYGDNTGSGVAFANRLKSYLWEEIKKFLTGDKLIIGICNGFQMLTNLGFLPAIDSEYGQRQVVLAHNQSTKYTARWVDMQVETKSPWLEGIKKLSLPIAHGEGKLVATDEVLQKLKQNKQVALRYFKGEICEYQDLAANPTGTIDNIAGLIDPTGRILGLMPHPERAIFFTHRPDWPYLKEKYLREGKPLPVEGPGIQIFRNAIEYFD